MDDVEYLERHLAWLRRQVEATAVRLAKLRATQKPLKPEQRDLAGMPAAEPKRRMQTEQEIFYDSFQDLRRKRMGASFTPDEPTHPAHINVAFKDIRAACESDEELLQLIEAFIKDSYWASARTPYPFKAFAAPKIWEKLLRSIREGRALP